MMVLLFYIYSVLSAVTGSFFAAILDGTSPASIVSPTLIATRITPASHGRAASPATPDRCSISRFMGMMSRIVMITPIRPEDRPIINVSALNTLEISDFDAPMLRSIPISFVLSYRL